MARTKRRELLPADETSLFCEQTAMVLKAGIPLYEGMETLAASNEAGRYAARFNGLRDTVQKTGSLYEAVKKAGIFPAYLVGMVGIGERAGKLDEVLDELSEYYRREADMHASIKNAVLYPAVLVLMLAAVVTVLVVSVLPVFTRVFAGLGITSASASGAAMRAGMGIGKAALIVIGLVLLFLIVVLLLLKSRKREAVFSWLCRTFPPIGNASTKLSAGRFASVLYVTLSAGCSVDSAMELAPLVIGDARYQKKLAHCGALLQEGRPIAEAMTDAGLFTGMQEKLVRFGAAAGQLDGVLKKLRDANLQDAEESVADLVAMIEPALVAVLSVVIGGVLLSVMLPLLSILSAIA